ncbi:hypothetical protein V8D89_004417 [Ganoderma adspersum]
MIALEDLGFFACYAFDHCAAVSGKDLEIASDWVGWDDRVAIFTRVTGEKAKHFRQPLDGTNNWFGSWLHRDHPVANKRAHGDGSMTWRENFTAFWAMWPDDVNWRDWAWIRKTNPRGYTLESWMRAKGYRGLSEEVALLKNMEHEKSVVPNLESIQELLRS